MGDHERDEVTSFATVVGVRATAVVRLVAGLDGAAVRDALGGADPAAALVDLLSGSGVPSVPSFAFVGREPEGVRVLLRGELRVVVRRSSGEEVRLAADGLTTWHESVHADHLEATIEGPAGAVIAVVALEGLSIASAPSAVPPPAPVAPEPRVEVVSGPSSPPTLTHRSVDDDEAFPPMSEAEADDGDGPDPFPPQPVLSPLRPWSGGLPSAAASLLPTPPPPPSGVRPVPLPPPPAAPGSGPVVLPTLPLPALAPSVEAVRCPSRHLNPPDAERCRTCGVPVVDGAVEVSARPSLGHLEFDSGLVVDVDRPLLIGRKPTADRHTGEPPGLVALPDDEGSLSRLHAEIRLDGWDVSVVDCGSLNGTVVAIPGEDPVQLDARTPFRLADGASVTLAGGASCTFRTGPR